MRFLLAIWGVVGETPMEEEAKLKLGFIIGLPVVLKLAE
jgi:hypothetical protein